MQELNFSKRLKNSREEADMSIFQAARFVNATPKMLINWERTQIQDFELDPNKPNQNDSYDMPSYVTVHSLAVLYGVDLQWLVSGIYSVAGEGKE